MLLGRNKGKIDPRWVQMGCVGSGWVDKHYKKGNRKKKKQQTESAGVAIIKQNKMTR